MRNRKIARLYIAHYRSDFYKKYMYIIVVIHRIHFFNRICVIMHFKEKSILTGRVLVHTVWQIMIAQRNQHLSGPGLYSPLKGSACASWLLKPDMAHVNGIELKQLLTADIFKKICRSLSQKVYVVEKICWHLQNQGPILHITVKFCDFNSKIVQFGNFFVNFQSLTPAVALTFHYSRSPSYTLLCHDLENISF